MENQQFANGGTYLNAKRTAFEFYEAERKYQSLEEKKTKLTEELGNKKPTAYQYTMAVIVVGLCVVLSYAEKTNCQQSLIGLGFTESASAALGYAAAALGLIAGHEMAAGLQEKTDEFTGKRIVFTRRFLFGLALGITYLCFQVFLIFSASNNAGGMQDTATFYSLYVLFVCLLEILLGAKLHSAILTISYLVICIRQRLLLRRMKSTAQQTEELYQRFLYEANKGGTTIQENIETEHIKSAREFYNNGFTQYATL